MKDGPRRLLGPQQSRTKISYIPLRGRLPVINPPTESETRSSKDFSLFIFPPIPSSQTAALMAGWSERLEAPLIRKRLALRGGRVN
jgi:hypothetical protein